MILNIIWGIAIVFSIFLVYRKRLSGIGTLIASIMGLIFSLGHASIIDSAGFLLTVLFVVDTIVYTLHRAGYAFHSFK